MDTISIDKLKIYCNHGVFRDEQISQTWRGYISGGHY